MSIGDSNKETGGRGRSQRVVQDMDAPPPIRVQSADVTQSAPSADRNITSADKALANKRKLAKGDTSWTARYNRQANQNAK